jgi:hypothetical protein
MRHVKNRALVGFPAINSTRGALNVLNLFRKSKLAARSSRCSRRYAENVGTARKALPLRARRASRHRLRLPLAIFVHKSFVVPVVTAGSIQRAVFDRFAGVHGGDFGAIGGH